MDENNFRATCGPKAQEEIIKKLLFEGIKKTEGTCSRQRVENIFDRLTNLMNKGFQEIV